MSAISLLPASRKRCARSSPVPVPSGFLNPAFRFCIYYQTICAFLKYPQRLSREPWNTAGSLRPRICRESPLTAPYPISYPRKGNGDPLPFCLTASEAPSGGLGVIRGQGAVSLVGCWGKAPRSAFPPCGRESAALGYEAWGVCPAWAWLPGVAV